MLNREPWRNFGASLEKEECVQNASLQRTERHLEGDRPRKVENICDLIDVCLVFVVVIKRIRQ